MTPDDYAETWGLALTVEDLSRERSQQTDGGTLGGSDAMGCAAKAVYTVRGEIPSNVPKKGKAQRGTYLHEGTLNAVKKLYPHKLIEQSLTVRLPSGLDVPLHPDEIDPEEPSVTDYKFVNDLALIRRTGPTDQQQAQRHLQYLAAHQAGLVPPEGLVRNLFVDSDDLDLRWVHQEPFSMDWVERADAWYGGVVYAVKHGEDGEREWPINLCKDYCPWFAKCRPPLTDSLNQIVNVELAQTVQIAFAARRDRKEAELIEKQAVSKLKGVTGRAGNVSVVSTTVNKTTGSYVKVDMQEVAG